MEKYQVTIKYGNPGEYKNSSQIIIVEAESELFVDQLAITKILESNVI